MNFPCVPGRLSIRPREPCRKFESREICTVVTCNRSRNHSRLSLHRHRRNIKGPFAHTHTGTHNTLTEREEGDFFPHSCAGWHGRADWALQVPLEFLQFLLQVSALPCCAVLFDFGTVLQSMRSQCNLFFYCSCSLCTRSSGGRSQAIQ